ncbi:uncharacterized protein LOC120642188 isoform X3 [Panicum virgatum]|uniref:uncharacterized protein LOC120642188 isoform X3 n=1 Tax=Panicum virgatum TaxID=38727 RepID=UPI0019D5DA54|nr:uncharacterized protein LOC120642188 isoform X3 [Panicum virgatum]
MILRSVELLMIVSRWEEVPAVHPDDLARQIRRRLGRAGPAGRQSACVGARGTLRPSEALGRRRHGSGSSWARRTGRAMACFGTGATRRPGEALGGGGADPAVAAVGGGGGADPGPPSTRSPTMTKLFRGNTVPLQTISRPPADPKLRQQQAHGLSDPKLRQQQAHGLHGKRQACEQDGDLGHATGLHGGHPDSILEDKKLMFLWL